MARLRFTILGCGSSGGVPRLGGPDQRGDWGACDPAEPKNRRRRCSMLVERVTERGTTRVLIDTSPDLREQLLDAGVSRLDGVVFTHAHADHTHGLDDLRQVVFALRHRLPVWADAPTRASLMARFGYAFETPPGSDYPPILDLHPLEDAVEIDGAGGTVRLVPFRADHGGIDALGFRVGALAYLPDVLTLQPEGWRHLDGLEVWVLDALRRTPHPTHIHLATALEWIARAAPARAVLTNLHTDMDHATLCAELPPHIRPAHDGMTIELDAPD